MYHLLKYNSGNMYLAEYEAGRLIIIRILQCKNRNVLGSIGDTITYTGDCTTLITSENIQDVLVQATIEAL